MNILHLPSRVETAFLLPMIDLGHLLTLMALVLCLGAGAKLPPHLLPPDSQGDANKEAQEAWLPEPKEDRKFHMMLQGLTIFGWA